jgi:hypothetical protein
LNYGGNVGLNKKDSSCCVTWRAEEEKGKLKEGLKDP